MKLLSPFCPQGRKEEAATMRTHGAGVVAVRLLD